MDTSAAVRLREGRILSRVEMVRHVAARVRSECNAFSVPFDDLVSCGMLGLIEAVDKYDEARVDTFDFYCRARIRGAIINELRKMLPGFQLPEELPAPAPVAAPAKRSIFDFFGLFTHKQRQAIEIRMTGATLSETGRALGISQQGAGKLIERAEWKARRSEYAEYQKAA